MAGQGRRGAVLGLLAGSSACADPESAPPPAMMEGRVLVEPVAGVRLCAGTEAWIEAEVARVQALTGQVPAFDLPVTLGAGAVEAECTDADDPQAVLGCTVGDGSAVAVFTTPTAFSHELVHALRRHYGLRTQAMFEEGFAEAIDGSEAYPRFETLDPGVLAEAWWPQAQVQLSPAEFRSGQSYRIATHFMDSVIEADGMESLAAFMRGGIDDSASALQERFERHFGASLVERSQAWRDAGERGYGRGDPCGDDVQTLPAEGTTLDVVVDCDRADVLGLSGGAEEAWTRRCLRLPARAAWAVTVEAEAGSVRWASVPGSCAEDTATLDAASFELSAGEQATVELGACDWALTFASERDVPAVFMLTMAPP